MSTARIKINVAGNPQAHKAAATTASKNILVPKICIPEAHISNISLCNIKAPTQKLPAAPLPTLYITLKGWLEYDLKYSERHNPVTPKDVKQCLNDAFTHSDVKANVHSVKTRDTKNEGKGFKTMFNIWIKPTAKLEDDTYLIAKLDALDTAVYDIMQRRLWRKASDNEHAPALKIAHPSNNSTIDTPEFLVTGLNLRPTG